MANNLIFDRFSVINNRLNPVAPFGLGRASVLSRVPPSEVDTDIQSHLEKLNKLLSKEILEDKADLLADRIFLNKPLTPEQVPDKWQAGSLVHDLAAGIDDPIKLTLSEYIGKHPAISILKYQFLDSLTASRDKLNLNQRTALSDKYPAIQDYLILHAFYIGDRKEIGALKDYILKDPLGVNKVIEYVIISAVRTIVNKDQVQIPEFNTDDSAFVKRVTALNLSFSSTSFNAKVKELVDELVHKKTAADIIEDADQTYGKGTIPPEIKPQLIKYIEKYNESSPVKITKGNNEYFLPLFISQIEGITDVADITETDRSESAKDFEVQFFTDDQEQIQISQLAVLCAAQLYYGMVLGEELEVFKVVDYFTHKYLVRGEFGIEDSRLRKDLQLYVFSNRFTDTKTKKIMDRTRPAERQMFYRQVFNERKTQTPESLIVNREFPKLWKVLMLESAKCLEWLRESYNPESFVSKQNVMQAVEDIQYNLSTHCTGMANVVTPLIYAELDFVIRRIFQHPEVIRQIAPQERTWWKVVEKLYMEMKHRRPKVTVMYNKARLGYDIIRSIAEYDAGTFEDINTFKAFLSTVEGFITTQSILQEALIDDLKKDDVEDEDMEKDEVEREEMRHNSNGYHSQVPQMAGAPGKGGRDDWDF